MTATTFVAMEMCTVYVTLNTMVTDCSSVVIKCEQHSYMVNYLAIHTVSEYIHMHTHYWLHMHVLVMKQLLF